MTQRSCILWITCRRNILPTGNIPFAIHKSLNFVMFLKTAKHHLFILMLQEKNPNRKTLVKLRISNHKLNIETGRYDKISWCDSEDEIRSLSV